MQHVTDYFMILVNVLVLSSSLFVVSTFYLNFVDGYIKILSLILAVRHFVREKEKFIRMGRD